MWPALAPDSSVLQCGVGTTLTIPPPPSPPYLCAVGGPGGLGAWVGLALGGVQRFPIYCLGSGSDSEQSLVIPGVTEHSLGSTVACEPPRGDVSGARWSWELW
ncbi:unnamed protein product [Rangifer tarandus platyrhynchus]|uniref:Uncharacterized protein n=1 Tax=Rangifer tarandus platyrhynchus TaxID=3082113 RepID=A0ABN8YK05_RANTA|nr:unnamed protein product [Rangifer tarandus platyrhynchus]